MDTKEKLQQCFEKLGFQNNFPANLHINPSTNFIWQQILNNVKPKKEVEVYKKNIIINRIKNQKLTNVSDYPVQEITTYNQLIRMKEDIAQMKARILEKQNKHMVLNNNNNANYLLINSMKERNEEKRIKIHAMKLNSEQYGNEIKKIQELLAKKGISLISNENSASPSAIYDNLQTLVEEMEKGKMVTKSSDFHHLDYTLSHKSTKKSSKTCFSTMKKSQRKERDLQRFASCRNLPTSRALFTDVYKENNRSATVKQDISSFDTSGDLLPESCFNFEADDEFLLPSKPIHKQKSITSDWNIMSKQRSMFESDMNLCDKSQIDEKNKLRRDHFIQALSNNLIIAKIEQIINTGNREVIWNSACSLLNNIKLELEQNVDKISTKNDEICSDDLLPLNFIYIQNNLLSLKSKKQIKILQSIISEKKMEIENKLTGLSDVSGNSLELQIDAIKLEAAVHFLHREVYNNNTVDHQVTLKNLKIKMDKLKTALMAIVKEIGNYFEVKEDLLQRIKTCQEETTVCVRKLKKFLFDPSWADSLGENINSIEMKVFQDYPMDFVKRFHFVDKDTFYRDSMTDFSLGQLISDDVLYEVTSLLQHPQNPPERVITILLKQINKLQVLSSLEFPSVILSDKQNFLDQYQEKETYINTFCENINISIHSSKVRHILNSSSYLRSNMDLWLDMPFRRFISDERLVDGKNYKEYEEVLDYLKKNKSK